MGDIHRWWEQRTAERFWLGIVRTHDGADELATPCGDERGIPGWRRRLIMHVKPGDLVFHFDPLQQAIVAWSTARGRVRDCRLAWNAPSSGPAPAPGAAPPGPSWSLSLDSRTALDEVVPLDSIARAQWDLFPALRALEDEVGEPLYYPFAMNDTPGTSLLAGYVFKLPALFVEGFAALVGAAGSQKWFRPARAVAPVAVGAATRSNAPVMQVAPAAVRASVLAAR